MRTKTYAIFGLGNVGRILATRFKMINLPRDQILILDTDPQKILAATQQFDFTPASCDEIPVDQIDVFLLAIPPDVIPNILQKLAPKLTPKQVIISFAASLPIEQIELLVPDNIPVVRVMVSAPSLVGRGMNSVAFSTTSPPQTKELVQILLDELGESIEVDESSMNWCVGLIAAAMRSLLPVLKGMAEAGEEAGFSRLDARYIAAQVMLGTAELALETEYSFEQIKALTPISTVDEIALEQIFKEATRTAKEKVEADEKRLFRG
jgi:pyrroline-5-carboxylate reductase